MHITELMELIKTRRSVRAYRPEPVSRETLQQLVEAAVWAPTGGSAQPWAFGIVDDPDMIANIATFSPGLFGGPPVILAMCVDESRAFKTPDGAGKDVLARMDVALAAQNLMLAAHAMGLGTCMVRSFNIPAVAALLELPPHIRIETLITLGVPAQPSGGGKRRPVEEVIFYNEWEGK